MYKKLTFLSIFNKTFFNFDYMLTICTHILMHNKVGTIQQLLTIVVRSVNF